MIILFDGNHHDSQRSGNRGITKSIAESGTKFLGKSLEASKCHRPKLLKINNSVVSQLLSATDYPFKVS